MIPWLFAWPKWFWAGVLVLWAIIGTVSSLSMELSSSNKTNKLQNCGWSVSGISIATQCHPLLRNFFITAAVHQIWPGLEFHRQLLTTLFVHWHFSDMRMTQWPPLNRRYVQWEPIANSTGVTHKWDPPVGR